jgi:murein L,D-transpeptidase YcbB/YkuD
MGIEIGLLFLILLAKAQQVFSPKAANQAADDAAKKAADAAKAAAAAAAAGDHATAAQKSSEAQAHAKQAQQLSTAAKTPAPWPQVVPNDLPPFPTGWAPASPVTSAMVARAFQLLPQLWAHGAGTWKPEKTGATWVIYQAQQMGDKQGVVAFTPKAGAAAAPAPGVPAASPITVTPGSALPTRPDTVTASTVPASKYPTLRVGSTGPSVVWLQQQLHLTADGKFGPNTQHAVIAFQQSHGLTPDGVVGPKTWNALSGGSAQAA